MLTNRGTPFSEHGWGLLLEDLRHLFLTQAGQGNDMNGGADDVTQDNSTGQSFTSVTNFSATLPGGFNVTLTNAPPVGYGGGEVSFKEVTVCVSGVTMKMLVLGSDPY